jgi:beta-mannosidase
MILNLTGKKAQIACGLLCCCSMAYAQSNDNSEVVLLHTGWEFSQAGTELWRTAEVPGTVHQDLIHHKLLPSPFYGMNEQKIQWVENEDWEYRTSFTVTMEQLERDDAQLIFEGLDTYADVYLNGSLLLKSDNMFVGLAEKEGATYIDLYSHFIDKQTGKMNTTYTNDGLHLLGKGYLKWVEIVKPYIGKK